jgi:hypothetical protein
MNAKRQRNPDSTASPTVHRTRLSDDAMATIAAEARAADLRVIEVDLNGCYDKAGLLDRTARALRFPDDAPRQWGAWFDALIDLRTRATGGGCIILLRRALGLQRSAPESLDTALALFEDAARLWQGRGLALRVYVDAEA